MFAVLLDDFSYRLFYLLHVITFMVAFTAGFVHPRLGAMAGKVGGDEANRINGFIAEGSMKVYNPALVLTGLFGLLMVVTSDDVYELSQTWISIAFAIWIAMLVILFAVMIPAEKRLAQGHDPVAEKKVMMFGISLHVLLLLMLIDMIWKPGL